MSKLIKHLNNKFFIRKESGIKLFDVSLRDGLQSKTKIYTFEEKKELLHKIIDVHKPDSIELGSLVSSKVLPQMNHSIELYEYAKNLNNDIKYYLLVPNKKKLEIALDKNVKNMSFISSFSNSFQERNIKKTLKETINEIKEIDKILYENNLKENKLYLSCFNYCPFEGVIDDITIMFNMLEYVDLKAFNEICLSDTTGNLVHEDFKRLFFEMIRLINVNKLSLHLHVNKDNEENVLEILQDAIKYDITKFDISCIEDGGCSVTMDKSKLNSNLSYDIIDKLLIK